MKRGPVAEHDSHRDIKREDPPAGPNVWPLRVIITVTGHYVPQGEPRRAAHRFDLPL